MTRLRSASFSASGSGSDPTQPANGGACPLDYRYEPADLARSDEETAEVLYVVGGVYGNPESLAALSSLLRTEPDARVVFNGDFNWFNVDDRSYAEVNEYVMRHAAIRGNVETELAEPETRGCGCGYPDWVDRDTAVRSDEIIRVLKGTARRAAALTTALGALPRFRVFRVGALRVAVVHGDAESLAGWGFAQEHLCDPRHLDTVKSWFRAGEVDVYACTHTCLPVLKRIGVAGRNAWVVNNGSAGLPNFAGTRYGLLTRIAVRPCDRIDAVYGTADRGVNLDAVPLHYDHAAWTARFLSNWPAGTPAYASYFGRIQNGPDYTPHQAVRF